MGEVDGNEYFQLSFINTDIGIQHRQLNEIKYSKFFSSHIMTYICFWLGRDLLMRRGGFTSIKR